MKKKTAALVTAAVLGAASFAALPRSAAAMPVAAEASLAAYGTGTGLVTAVPADTSSLPGEEPNGQPQVSGPEALAVLRAAFPYLPDLGETRVELDEDYYSGRMVWHINAREVAPYRPGPSLGYWAAVDAVTGDVLNMHCRQAGAADPQEHRGIISREEARRTVEALARKLQPDKLTQMRYRNVPVYHTPGDSLNIAHRFHWERVHDGISVSYDGLNIAVDALTGQVTNYDFTWRPDLKLPPAQAVVDAGALPARVIETAGMVLSYYVSPDRYTAAVPEPKLAYQLNSRYAHMLDAGTGKAIDYQGRPVADSEKRYPDTSGIQGVANPPAPSGKPVSPAEARKAAEDFFRLIGVEGAVERGGSGSSSGPLGRQEYWYYGVQGAAGQVGIDISTGKVVQYHHYDRYGYQPDPADPPVTREEALRKAWELVKMINPEYAGNVVAEEGAPEWVRAEGTHEFRFARVVNGVVFPLNGIEVSLSAAGEVVGYRCDWNRLPFPAVEDVITPEEAAQKWLDHAVYKPAWFFPSTPDHRGYIDEATLVYMLDGRVEAIDAVTGEVLSWGRPLEGDAADGYDFTGSWAAQPLQLLADSGLLPPPDEFDRTSPVTRRDAIRVLMAATDRYHGSYDGVTEPLFQDVQAADPDFGVLEAAVALGVIDKGGAFDPDRPVDRQTLATWLVNAVGYQDVTRITNRIETPFQDLADLCGREQNYVGLAYGLGFMRGDGSARFRPGGEVTWEELSAAVLKALPQIRSRMAW